jgi:hypothetical protein
MKKCIFLLLAGVALISCRENPNREECIRLYYEFSIKADSLYKESERLNELMTHVEDSLTALNKDYFNNERYQSVNYEWMNSMSSYRSSKEYEIKYYDMQKAHRTLFDRNYFRIYKKELIKQGRIKE